MGEGEVGVDEECEFAKMLSHYYITLLAGCMLRLHASTHDTHDA